jgi:hypothetical protein
MPVDSMTLNVVSMPSPMTSRPSPRIGANLTAAPATGPKLLRTGSIVALQLPSTAR